MSTLVNAIIAVGLIVALLLYGPDLLELIKRASPETQSTAEANTASVNTPEVRPPGRRRDKIW